MSLWTRTFCDCCNLIHVNTKRSRSTIVRVEYERKAGRGMHTRRWIRLARDARCEQRTIGQTSRRMHLTRQRTMSHTRSVPVTVDVSTFCEQRLISTNFIDTHLLWPSNKNASRCTSRTSHIRVHPTLQSHWKQRRG